MKYGYSFLFSLFIVASISVSLGSVSANPRGPLVELNPNATLCEYPSDELEGEVRLDPNCYYQQSFTIEEPDTTLDCNGAQLRGSDEYLINIKRNADRAKIMNCYIYGGKGVAVRVRNPRNDETPDEVRALGADEVVLQNIQISHSEGVGLHLHVYTTGVTIKDSIIIDNSSAGIYLSPYGKWHHIENNLISRNGHIKPDGVPRIGWYRREGVAIDGSSENIIIDNEISENSFGGIFLYKNCWEHAAVEPNSRPRTEHARANLIQGNLFTDQPFGIWVASRQSRDLELMECGDPTPYDNPIDIETLLPPIYWTYPSSYADIYRLSLNSVHIWPDYAEENVITENRFETIILGGIRIEDDDTEVTHNIFIGEFDYLFLGSPFRARLDNRPVLNTVIQSNAYISVESSNFIDHLALMPDEHLGTQLQDNHQACLLENGVLILHGEFVIQTVQNEVCPEIELHCEEGLFNQSPIEASCITESSADSTDQMMTQSDIPEDQGIVFGIEPDANMTDETQSSRDLIPHDQGCLINSSKSPPVLPFCLLYLFIFRNKETMI
jgi:parallel beta-helix repeat protein